MAASDKDAYRVVLGAVGLVAVAAKALVGAYDRDSWLAVVNRAVEVTSDHGDLPSLPLRWPPADQPLQSTTPGYGCQPRSADHASKWL